MPVRKPLIERSGSPMELWIELGFVAERAFEDQPIDDATLQGIFAYARYCLTASDGWVNTAVAVAFVEHLPTHAAVRDDLHRWISQAEFDGLKKLLQYFPSAEEFAAFEAQFKQRAVEWVRAGNRVFGA